MSAHAFREIRCGHCGQAQQAHAEQSEIAAFYLFINMHIGSPSPEGENI
jgi:hypothetical protein